MSEIGRVATGPLSEQAFRKARAVAAAGADLYQRAAVLAYAIRETHLHVAVLSSQRRCWPTRRIADRALHQRHGLHRRVQVFTCGFPTQIDAHFEVYRL
jgi:hypothetical protein